MLEQLQYRLFLELLVLSRIFVLRYALCFVALCMTLTMRLEIELHSAFKFWTWMMMLFNPIFSTVRDKEGIFVGEGLCRVGFGSRSKQ